MTDRSDFTDELDLPEPRRGLEVFAELCRDPLAMSFTDGGAARATTDDGRTKGYIVEWRIADYTPVGGDIDDPAMFVIEEVHTKLGRRTIVGNIEIYVVPFLDATTDHEFEAAFVNINLDGWDRHPTVDDHLIDLLHDMAEASELGRVVISTNDPDLRRSMARECLAFADGREFVTFLREQAGDVLERAAAYHGLSLRPSDDGYCDGDRIQVSRDMFEGELRDLVVDLGAPDSISIIIEEGDGGLEVVIGEADSDDVRADTPIDDDFWKLVGMEKTPDQADLADREAEQLVWDLLALVQPNEILDTVLGAELIGRAPVDYMIDFVKYDGNDDDDDDDE